MCGTSTTKNSGIPEPVRLVNTTVRLVNTTTVRIVWITLPGADRSYALSEEQASALLRQLEEVV